MSAVENRAVIHKSTILLCSERRLCFIALAPFPKYFCNKALKMLELHSQPPAHLLPAMLNGITPFINVSTSKSDITLFKLILNHRTLYRLHSNSVIAVGSPHLLSLSV